VRLSPCARAGQVEVVADVMRAISERELAYVHLAHERPSSTRPPPAESVSIAACAERQAFRSDVSCALLASDLVDLDVAMSAVERRWADAIGFLQADDDPDFVARTVREHLDA
jgi:2,4-dienoyl-CoA reductase-like NADH-dependent reductase (Old Yellow Enzyme family)